MPTSNQYDIIKEVEDYLSTFPKQRPPLPDAHSAGYLAHYFTNREGEGLASRITARLEAWMHRQVAGVPVSGHLLEIGAGTLNHVRYEESAATYDIVEPFRELWEHSHHLQRIRNVFGNIREIGGQETYDKIASIAVLEHVLDLPVVLAYCGRLLKTSGTFCAGIPSEGGLLWFLSWRFGSGLAYRLRTGLSYVPMMRHEHVNRAPEIESLCRYLFEDVFVRRFPLPALHGSFYSVLFCQKPNRERCRDIISRFREE